MKRMKKKLLSILLAMAFLAAVLPALSMEVKADTARVVASGDGGSVTWKIFEKSGGTYHLEFTGNGKIENQASDVPGPWLNETYRTKITSLAIADGITYVGNNAFWYNKGGLHNCNSLYLAEGITSIGEHAFCDCAGLSYLRVPSTVTFIGNSAFDHITTQYFTLPAALREYGAYSSICPKVDLENRYYPGSEAAYLTIKFDSSGSSYYTSSGYYKKIHFGSVDPLYNNVQYTSYEPWIEEIVIDEDDSFDCSEWAILEMKRANELGLIPSSLRNADLRRQISRAEFAAVAVRVYENLSKRTVQPAALGTFSDTSDPDVLKASAIQAVNGVGGGRYDPYAVLSREQCATMLTRVFKKHLNAGYTIDRDAQYPLSFAPQPPFADDANISRWARESVYFMAANGIIKGIGNNTFAPRNMTSQEEAIGYATATREASIAIALRMTENLR